MNKTELIANMAKAASRDCTGKALRLCAHCTQSAPNTKKGLNSFELSP
ncbi:MAG: hypothetical protein J7L69_06835 [Desulfobulbaceae bacterium]|nr:hypothetical protein [Desulfobulbaceae bacterium]